MKNSSESNISSTRYKDNGEKTLQETIASVEWSAST